MLAGTAGDAGYTFVAVVTNVAASVSATFGALFARDAAGSRGFNFHYQDSVQVLRNYVPTSASAVTTRLGATSIFGSARLLTTRYDGTGGTFDTSQGGTLDNGTLTGTVPATVAHSGATLRVGCDGWGDYMTGDIAEIVFYRRALSSGELDAVHAYLTAKYFP